MATNPGSVILDNPGGNSPPGTTTTSPAPAEQKWYSENYNDVVTAKGWDKPDAVLESYVNLEKVAGVPAEQRADRILIKPGDTATPEEIKAFREKAGFAAPADAKDYGFTDEQMNALPVLKHAADWARDAGLPKEMFSPFVEKAMEFEKANVEAWNKQSEADIVTLKGELGDKFDDFAERARRFAKASGFTPEEYAAIEFAIGTKTMLTRFAEAGKSLVEAQAPDPNRKPGDGNFTMSAEAAKTAAAAKRADPAFQARYLSPNPMVRQAAIDEMEILDKAAAGASATGA